jgi:hypothetical protein
MLNPLEREFLGVFLHEATASPFFQGPASRALKAIRVEYRDISYLSWAYHQEAPPSNGEWGHAAEVAPPLPWATREAALARDGEIKRIWEQQRTPVHSAQA